VYDARMIEARDLIIQPCKASDVKDFIETYHYSKSINGVKITQCFKVLFNDRLVGAVLYGALSTTAWKKFSDKEHKVLELRRLVLLDEVGKNSESRVIGASLRWIKKNLKEIEVIVSYADPNHGHTGIIYRASNFQYLGLSASDVGYEDIETGKKYHSRALRTKYKGEYKPFVKRLREKLEKGLLVPIKLKGKHCFIFKMINK
jgi:hypothetical protein